MPLTANTKRTLAYRQLSKQGVDINRRDQAPLLYFTELRERLIDTVNYRVSQATWPDGPNGKKRNPNQHTIRLNPGVMTLAELSRRTCIHYIALSAWKNRRRNLSIEKLDRIMHALEISAADLIRDTEYRPVEKVEKSS